MAALSYGGATEEALEGDLPSALAMSYRRLVNSP